jgi:hypothetical protein
LNEILQVLRRTSLVGEIRWQVIKVMLDEFPTLKEKVEDYLKEEQKLKKKSLVLSHTQ